MLASTGSPTTTSGTDSTPPSLQSPRQTNPTSPWWSGADLNGQLLKIGVLAADDNDYVIHAMSARAKYVKMIKPKRGGQP